MKKILTVIGFSIFITLVAMPYIILHSVNTSEGDMKVVFISTKEDADAILIYQGEEAVLIDTGEKQDGEHILEVLEKNGIKSLKYMILTHGDKDHIGSAMDILEKIPAERVVESYYDGNKELQELNSGIAELGINLLYPTHNTRLLVGDMVFTLYPPLEKHYNKDNNYSLAVMVNFGEVNMLFTGDALRKRSEELMLVHWPDIDLYKVPHHGRANRATIDLFKALNPGIGVVTSDDSDSAVKEGAEMVGCKLYYTLEEEYSFVSDGKSIWVE